MNSECKDDFEVHDEVEWSLPTSELLIQDLAMDHLPHGNDPFVSRVQCETAMNINVISARDDLERSYVADGCSLH